jgi:hypothetical protein
MYETVEIIRKEDLNNKFVYYYNYDSLVYSSYIANRAIVYIVYIVICGSC